MRSRLPGAASPRSSGAGRRGEGWKRRLGGREGAAGVAEAAGRCTLPAKPVAAFFYFLHPTVTR
eukprot:scaffold107033_cov21-Phaeocystis_antarctica.AAC.1